MKSKNQNLEPWKCIEDNLIELSHRYGYMPKKKHPFKGENFITRNIVARKHLLNGIWYELSWGIGIDSDYIIGVTFATQEHGQLYGISEAAYTITKAQDLLEIAEAIPRSEIKNAIED